MEISLFSHHGVLATITVCLTLTEGKELLFQGKEYYFSLFLIQILISFMCFTWHCCFHSVKEYIAQYGLTIIHRYLCWK